MYLLFDNPYIFIWKRFQPAAESLIWYSYLDKFREKWRVGLASLLDASRAWDCQLSRSQRSSADYPILRDSVTVFSPFTMVQSLPNRKYVKKFLAVSGLTQGFIPGTYWFHFSVLCLSFFRLRQKTHVHYKIGGGSFNLKLRSMQGQMISSSRSSCLLLMLLLLWILAVFKKLSRV